MSAAGDLRTILTLDDYEFVTGLREAAQETRQFAATANDSMGKVASARARTVGQLGFAMQDFSSIMATGGKNALGRAVMSTMNNVQMLGASFGPTGMAVTALAGAVGSVLIPQLLEGKSAFDGIAESTRFATGQLEDHIRRTNEAIAFRDKLAKAGNAKQAEGMGEDIALQKKQAQATITALKEEAERIQKQVKSLSSQGGMGAEDPFSLRALLFPKQTYEKHFEIGPQIEALQAQAQKIHKQVASKLADLRELNQREQLVDQKQPELEAIDEQLEREKEVNHVLEKREALLDQLRKKAETPAERLTEQLRDLKDLFRESAGGMSIDDFDKISDSYFKEFQHSIAKHEGGGKNVAAVAGTVQGYEAIAESIRATERAPENTEELDYMRQQLEELRRIVRALGSDSPDEAVHTGPGWQGGGF